MRIRTPLASVWVDQPTSTRPAIPQPTPDAPPAEPLRNRGQVRWAARPYQGRLGRYVAVRLRGTVMDVAITEPGVPLRWVSASAALTTAQAKEWLALGFGS